MSEGVPQEGSDLRDEATSKERWVVIEHNPGMRVWIWVNDLGPVGVPIANALEVRPDEIVRKTAFFQSLKNP